MFLLAGSKVYCCKYVLKIEGVDHVTFSSNTRTLVCVWI